MFIKTPFVFYLSFSRYLSCNLIWTLYEIFTVYFNTGIHGDFILTDSEEKIVIGLKGKRFRYFEIQEL